MRHVLKCPNAPLPLDVSWLAGGVVRFDSAANLLDVLAAYLACCLDRYFTVLRESTELSRLISLHTTCSLLYTINRADSDSVKPAKGS